MLPRPLPDSAEEPPGSDPSRTAIVEGSKRCHVCACTGNILHRYAAKGLFQNPKTRQGPSPPSRFSLGTGDVARSSQLSPEKVMSPVPSREILNDVTRFIGDLMRFVFLQ